MSIQRQFGKGVAWMAAGNWIEQAINFAVFVILARLLGAEAYGILAMAAAFVLISEALVRDSFSDFLIAAHDPKEAHFNATFWLLAGLGGALMVLMLVAAGPVAGFYGEPEVAGLMRALSPTVLMIAITAVPVAILRRDLRFRALSLRAIAGVAAGGVVAISMALSGFGIWSLAAQRLVQVGVNILLAWMAVAWRPGWGQGREQLREVLRFGGAVLGLRAAELASIQLPSVLIGVALGPVALGLFSIAWRLVEIGSFLIVTPLRLASQPAFARMRRDGQLASTLLVEISRLSGMVAFAAFAGLAVLAGPVIELLFGAQWLGAAPVLRVLALLGAYFCIEKIHQAFCLAAGRARATTLLAWAETGLACLLVWLARTGGVEAMAAGLVAAFFGIWILRFLVVAEVAALPVSALLRLHLPPLMGAVVMALAVMALLAALPPLPPLSRVLAGMVAGLVVFTLFAALFMPDRLSLMRSFLPGRATADRNAP